MTAGDVGTAIIANAGGYNMTGCTATILAAPGTEPNPIGNAISLTPVNIASDGLTGTYYSSGKDINEGGPWQFQLKVRTPGGQTFSSPWFQAYINPLL